MAPKKEEISLRLKKSRELKGLSQREVSQLSGINNKTISGYENNVSEPDLLTISKLASIYGVSIDWIINGLHFKIEGSNGVLEEQLEHSRELLLKFKELAEQIKV
ncbi:helix-turn-helix domain-containing protein [Paenibacillus chitinolyticus]|uniref:Helix-turn-helix transcriptional regulator n=1 Tax=Paenibacillus chitinolyticus TaxID=79263 RepID=A0ABT4FRD7_9BACL|nr:helix-turn-helix transcriptional regulator [Paenibacillus chitinolyticus]MCY9593974.1 helix-turn-helix transcriptional regulator [Paenibacillus chitinolyticus]MCY9599629.1 helix-turn-helix transcriptional regulator [Paenibacillus chitinolyticus]